ncbi:MAG: glycosyltransferase [Egibacteraceae bacterium]
MTVVFLVADRISASSRLRVLQYVPLLRRDGLDVRVCATRPSKYLPRPRWLPRPRFCQLLYSVAATGLIVLQRAWQIAVIVPRGDVVVLQKDLLFRSRAWFLERAVLAVARSRRARVVFDLDDAIYLGTSQRLVPHMRAKGRALAQAATVVLAGSQAIASELRPHSKAIAVMPTCIAVAARPDRCYARTADALRLVWSGTPTNARYLDLLAGAVRVLRRDGPVRVEIVTRLADLPPGALPPGLLAGLDVRLTEWSEAGEAAALAAADIALAPLADNPWTRAKCGGRLLAYFASAVPVVASPVGAQAEMVQHGATGLLATSASEWAASLAALRDSAELRRRLGQAGRRFVEDNRSAQTRYPQWRDVVLGADAG